MDEATVEYLKDLNLTTWKNIPKCLIEVMTNIVALLLSHEAQLLSFREFENEQHNTNKGANTRLMMLEENMNKLIIETASKFNSTLKDNMASVGELRKQAENKTSALAAQIYEQAEALKKSTELAETQRQTMMSKIEELEEKLTKKEEEITENTLNIVEEAKRELKNCVGLYGDTEECKTLGEYLIKLKNNFKEELNNQSQSLRTNIQLEHKELYNKIEQVNELTKKVQEQVKDESKNGMELTKAIEDNRKEIMDKIIITNENIKLKCELLEDALKKLEAEHKQLEENNMVEMNQSIVKLGEVQTILLSSFETQKNELQTCKDIINHFNITFKELMNSTEELKPRQVYVKDRSPKYNVEEVVRKRVEYNEDVKVQEEVYSKENLLTVSEVSKEPTKGKAIKSKAGEIQSQNEIKDERSLPSDSKIEQTTPILFKHSERNPQRTEEIKGTTNISAIGNESGIKVGISALPSINERQDKGKETNTEQVTMNEWNKSDKQDNVQSKSREQEKNGSQCFAKGEVRRMSVYEKVGKNVSFGQEEESPVRIEEAIETSNRNINSIDNIQDSYIQEPILNIIQKEKIREEEIKELPIKQTEEKTQSKGKLETKKSPDKKKEEKKMVVDKKFKETIMSNTKYKHDLTNTFKLQPVLGDNQVTPNTLNMLIPKPNVDVKFEPRPALDKFK